MKKKWDHFIVSVFFPMVVLGRSLRKREEYIDLYIDIVTESLRKSIDRHDFHQVCQFSRALYHTGQYILTFPNLWPEERLQKTADLLQRAAKETKKTCYHGNCVTRAEKFLKHVDDLRQSDEPK